MDTMNPFTSAYLKFFPSVRPTLFQLELIESSISDMAAWRKTLIFWAGNDFRPQSVFKMVEYYKEQTKADIGRYVPIAEPEPNCAKCLDFGYNIEFPDPTNPMDMVKTECECSKEAKAA